MTELFFLMFALGLLFIFTELMYLEKRVWFHIWSVLTLLGLAFTLCYFIYFYYEYQGEIDYLHVKTKHLEKIIYTWKNRLDKIEDASESEFEKVDFEFGKDCSTIFYDED